MLPTMRGHTNDHEGNRGHGTALPRSLKQIRESIGLTQPELARLLGLSTRWVAMQETSSADALRDRKVAEIVRLLEALSQVVQPSSIRAWLSDPNPAFDGLKPVEVIERGEIDRVWRMVFYLESGVPS
jgi:transcriptional regulator with XRE-family HTH domain